MLKIVENNFKIEGNYTNQILLIRFISEMFRKAASNTAPLSPEVKSWALLTKKIDEFIYW